MGAKSLLIKSLRLNANNEIHPQQFTQTQKSLYRCQDNCIFCNYNFLFKKLVTLTMSRKGSWAAFLIYDKALLTCSGKEGIIGRISIVIIL
jgi:hypothetical protein